MRADLFLFNGGYVKSRQKAKILIENKCVLIDGKVVSKPSFEIDELFEHKIEITDNCAYVSRGGLKLEAILDYAKIDVQGRKCLDIGASTGGFTDCLLKRGATVVYALDSGSNQLDIDIKNDPRVVSIENFNARNDLTSVINGKVDVITIDVSFISQTLITNQLDGVYSIGWIKNTKIDPVWIWSQRIPMQYDMPALYSLIFLSPSSAQATGECKTPNLSPYWCLDKH